MKNKQSAIVYFLAVINGLYPLLCLISYLFGYSVYLSFSVVYTLWLAVIFIYSNYFIKKNEEAEFSKSARICAAFLPLITAVNLGVYVFKYGSLPIALIMGVCLIFAAVIAEKVIKGNMGKVLSVVSSGFICLIAVVLSFFAVSSSYLFTKRVEKFILSPDRTYYAEVINVDQGALGGDTVVYVHRSRGVNLFFLSFNKIPQMVYIGEWGEYKTMQIEWKNENCLLINSEEYNIEI